MIYYDVTRSCLCIIVQNKKAKSSLADFVLLQKHKTGQLKRVRNGVWEVQGQGDLDKDFLASSPMMGGKREARGWEQTGEGGKRRGKKKGRRGEPFCK